MDGYEATRQLRRDARHVNLPIIAMTAHAMADERQRCMVLGMNGHISKPIDPDVLYATLAEYLTLSAAERRGPVTAADPRMGIATKPQDAMALPQIVGLDSATGLRHANGNKQLYERLLRRFSVDFAGFATRMEATLQAGNHDEALRQAHTLKGLAATLGAHEIRALATGLEQGLREQDWRLAQEQLTDIGDALEALLSAINMVFVEGTALDSALAPNDTVATPAQTPPATPIEQWLPRLKELLSCGDTDARTLWEAEKTGIGDQLPPPVVEEVSKAIERFDFEGALEGLAAKPEIELCHDQNWRS
jgi:two-component system, sensor histidine kinase and response regulator